MTYENDGRQVSREQVLAKYVRGELTRDEAVARVGIEWVELAERQRQAMQEDLAWAIEGLDTPE